MKRMGLLVALLAVMGSVFVGSLPASSQTPDRLQ